MAEQPIGKEEINKIARALEGPAYIAVGFGVLGFQRAQVYRLALQHQLGAVGGMAREAGLELARQLTDEVGRRTGPARQTAGDLAGEAVQHLPEAARDLLDAMGNLITELPAEAKGLVQEVAALGRFAMHAAGAPASRYASRQGA